MRTNGRFKIIQGFFIGIPLSNNNPLNSQGIGNIAAGMFSYNDLILFYKIPLLILR